MDEFDQSDFILEKETNDSHNTCYQNAIHYKENALIKNCKRSLFSLVFVIKLGGSITEIGLRKTDKGLKA